jgi:hypothetical protein
VTFSEVHFSANPDILFAFDFLDGPSNELARASSIGNKFTLQFDTAETWSTAWPTPAGHIDFNTVAIHEVGHTLGLRHSSIEGATMYPVPGASSPNSLPLTDRTLATDDWVGASASYDKWQQLPGCATDVGVGTGGGVWVTGCGAVPGGFSIHQLTGGGTTWTSAPGGAVRIAVGPDNVPWITNDQGVIFRRTSSSATSGSWQILPGCAKDIGVGADGSAWVVGCNPVSDGHAIYKWNGSAFVQSGNQGAKAIAVGAGGEPWIVTDSALMFRRSTNSPTSGSWLPLPGTGHDIGINPGNYAWSTGGAVVPGGLAIQLYNEQDGVAGVADAPALNRWLRIPGPLSANGGAMRVSVGSAGNPYVIHIDGRIFRAM